MNNDRLLEGLKMAIQTELNGVEFYKMAAEKTEDPKGKEVFNLLARDEMHHFNELRKQYTSLITNNAMSPSLTLQEAQSIFHGESPIFSDELRSKIKEKHFEMSALSIGALLESNSIDFYRDMKEKTDDPTAKVLFERLQKWEEGHLEAITKQLDVLKEEYWAEQHFSPLF